MPNGVGIDVEAIVRNYGKFDVATVPDLTVGGSPFLGIFVPEFDLIMVEEHCLPSRSRFTLAHELGHAELEHDFGQLDGLFSSGKRSVFTCTSSDENAVFADDRVIGARKRREARANRFAATLLMPADLVRELWRQHRDERRIGDLLVVSREALGYRLAELGIR